MTATQCERVLAALERSGAHGITQVDFALPNVIDGGPPITRVAARIKELRDQGHPIRNGHIRDRCRIYRLLTAMFTVDSQSGCWIWRGTLNPVSGYGYIRNEPAHRVVYRSERGPIPAGYELDHLCRVPACVNPAHLEPVPHSVNVQRGDVAKLRPDEVETIRESDDSNAVLARRYDVATTTIWRIRSGGGWDGEHTAGPDNRVKTHCKRGHPFDDENTYRTSDGRRACKTCRAADAERRRARNKNAAPTPKPKPEPEPEPSREFVPMDEHAPPDPLFDMPPVVRSPYEDAA